MLIPRSLQADHNQTTLTIDIGSRHAEDAVPAHVAAPVSDPLPGAAEQCENRLVPKGRSGVDKLLHVCGFQTLRYFVGDSASEAITLLGARRHVTAGHPVAQILVVQLPRRRVDTATPYPSSILKAAR
jgi:hypothetical protein